MKYILIQESKAMFCCKDRLWIGEKIDEGICDICGEINKKEGYTQFIFVPEIKHFETDKKPFVYCSDCLPGMIRDNCHTILMETDNLEEIEKVILVVRL